MWQGTLPSLADRHGSASDGSAFFKTALRIGAFAKISIDLLSSIMPSNSTLSFYSELNPPSSAGIHFGSCQKLIEYGFLLLRKSTQQHLLCFCHVTDCFPAAGFSGGCDMNQFDTLIGSISERFHEALLLQA